MEFRKANAVRDPDGYNGAVHSFGDHKAKLLVIGLAPGLQGANKTGRPFTGDQAGELIYPTLEKFGYTRGAYKNHADDGFELVNCAVTNAIACVPPQNKPVASEIKSCRPYLTRRILSMPDLKIVLTLGKVAHDSTLAALELRKRDFPFKHGQTYKTVSGLVLISSYHCSRYNINTKRLTESMFHDVFRKIAELLD